VAGWVYELENGVLRDLEIDLNYEFRRIYDSFRHD